MSGSFEFLEPSGAAVERSPMEGQALAAGARMEVRDGWNVAVSYPANGSVTWTDMSHLRKLEVHGAHELTPGLASKVDQRSLPFLAIRGDPGLVAGRRGRRTGRTNR